MSRLLFTRRRFLGAAGAAAAATLATPGRAQPAGGPLLRKDVRDLTVAEVDLLREAFRRLQNRPSGDPTSYDYQAGIHGRECPHANWWFLPWHRAYVYYFERLLQDAVRDLSPPVLPTIPYWNWTDQREIPMPFRGVFPANPLANNTRYSLNLDNGQIGAANMRRVVDQANSFIAFGSMRARTKRERPGKSPFEYGPHDHIHVRTGGDMDDPPTAANDPIFWSHHANIDRWWMYWLSITGHQNPNDSLPNDRPWYDLVIADFIDVDGSVISRTVRQIMTDPAIQSVQYAPHVGPPPPLVAAVPALPKTTPATSEEHDMKSSLHAKFTLSSQDPLSIEFAFDEETRRRFAVDTAKAQSGSVLLNVIGLELPPHPGDGAIDVHLNPSARFAELTEASDSYVASMPLTDFAHHGSEAEASDEAAHDHVGGANRLVDVTAKLAQQLESKNYDFLTPLRVTFVVRGPEQASPDGQAHPPTPIAIADVELFIEQ